MKNGSVAKQKHYKLTDVQHAF